MRSIEQSIEVVAATVFIHPAYNPGERQDARMTAGNRVLPMKCDANVVSSYSQSTSA